MAGVAVRERLRLFVRLVGWGTESRCVGALGANLVSPDVKDDGNGDEDRGDNTEKRGGPLNTHAVEHVAGEQGETGTAKGSKEGVSGNGRSGAGVC